MTATNDKHINSGPGGGMWRVGRVMEKAGLREKAEEVYKLGIRRNPDNIASYSLLGNNLYFQGKLDEATFYLETALKLKPQSDEVRFTLGHIYTKKEDFPKAVFHLEKAKDVYGYDSAFVLTISRSLSEDPPVEGCRQHPTGVSRSRLRICHRARTVGH